MFEDDNKFFATNLMLNKVIQDNGACPLKWLLYSDHGNCRLQNLQFLASMICVDTHLLQRVCFKRSWYAIKIMKKIITHKVIIFLKGLYNLAPTLPPTMPPEPSF